MRYSGRVLLGHLCDGYEILAGKERWRYIRLLNEDEERKEDLLVAQTRFDGFVYLMLNILN